MQPDSPKVAFNNAEHHIGRGARREDAMALAQAVVDEESVQKIDQLATTVALQIRAAEQDDPKSPCHVSV